MNSVPELVLLPFLDPMVHNKPEQFDFENPPYNPKELKEKLETAMYNFKGAGLSANQVGIPYAVFVMAVNDSDTIGTSKGIFNPKIIGLSKEVSLFKEGCLSLPGVWLTLARPVECIVTFQDEEGVTHMGTLSGISSRVFQHEFDHMLGKDFTQLASPLKLKRALAKLTKKEREGYVPAI